LLLRARREEDIDRLLHGRRSAAAAPQQGAQQQMRAVSRSQLTYEAEYRLDLVGLIAPRDSDLLDTWWRSSSAELRSADSIGLYSTTVPHRLKW